MKLGALFLAVSFGCFVVGFKAVVEMVVGLVSPTLFMVFQYSYFFLVLLVGGLGVSIIAGGYRLQKEKKEEPAK